MSITRRLIVRLKETLFKKPRIQWSQTDDESIIWRIPNESVPDVKNIGEIEVKEGQRAALYRGGVLATSFPPGVNRVVDDFDSAYLIDVTPKKRRVGIRAPDYPITKDNVSFGFSGDIIFRVMEDPTSIGNFISKIVSNKEDVSPRHISSWLRDGLLFQVFKELLADYTYEEFRSLDKLELDMNLETKLGFDLKDYGIEVISFEVKYYTEPKTF